MADPTLCPRCGSTRTRRGGRTLWSVYLVLVAAAVLLVMVWKVNAAILAGVMLAVIALANLLLSQRVCLDCGEQWRPRVG